MERTGRTERMSLIQSTRAGRTERMSLIQSTRTGRTERMSLIQSTLLIRPPTHPLTIPSAPSICPIQDTAKILHAMCRGSCENISMCRLCLGYVKRTRQDLTKTINTLKDQLRQLVGYPSLVAPVPRQALGVAALLPGCSF